LPFDRWPYDSQEADGGAFRPGAHIVSQEHRTDRAGKRGHVETATNARAIVMPFTSSMPHVESVRPLKKSSA
jgi:hypothetical protein